MYSYLINLYITIFILSYALIYTIAADISSNVKILNYENEIDPSGNYKFSYELSDGSRRIERGELRNAGSENEYIAVFGEYEYTDTFGKNVKTYYKADDEGYQILDQPQDGLKPITPFKPPIPSPRPPTIPPRTTHRPQAEPIAPSLLASIIGGGLAKNRKTIINANNI